MDALASRLRGRCCGDSRVRVRLSRRRRLTGRQVCRSGRLTDLDDDLRLVTLPEAARFLCVSCGTLYDLLTSGQLPSVHIGRARRVPMGELRRFVRERLERDTLQLR